MARRITGNQEPEAPETRPRGRDRVRVPKTAELVAAQIRRQIIRGEVREGEALLPESELMAEFGVSRPTLREAFRILESESLISVTRGSRGGARVHAPDIEAAARYAGLFLQYQQATLEDVQAARAVVEPPAARMLAERRDAKACQALRELIEEEKVAMLDGDGDAYAELSTQFHEQVMEHAGNQTLALVVGMLHDIIERHAATSMEVSLNEKALKKSVRSQEKLVALIEAGDADGAEKHWREHIRAAAQSVLDKAARKSVVDLFD
jgi:DNA-binding FadR family transcriptional regulator